MARIRRVFSQVRADRFRIRPSQRGHRVHHTEKRGCGRRGLRVAPTGHAVGAARRAATLRGRPSLREAPVHRDFRSRLRVLPARTTERAGPSGRRRERHGDRGARAGRSRVRRAPPRRRRVVERYEWNFPRPVGPSFVARFNGGFQFRG